MSGARLTLRPATPDDEARLLRWRNDPETRAASFTPDVVSAEAHAEWFARKLADPATAVLIVEGEGQPVGQVRLERTAERVAEIHIALAPDARGSGLGRAALRLACEEARGLLGVEEVHALVKPDNHASLHAFRAAGFAEVDASPEAVRLVRRAGDSRETG